MARKKGDGKRAIQDLASAAGDYNRITEAQWRVLEVKLGCDPLPRYVRRRIDMFNAIFSIFQPGYKASVKVRKIVPAIVTWRRRTEVLRRKLSDPSEARSPDGPIRRDWIEKTYFAGKRLKAIGRNFHLEFLAHALDAAVAAAVFVEQELSDPNYKGAESRELWFMWVALIEHTLCGCDIHTSARNDSDKQQTASPFVRFIEELQRQLPADCQKYGTTNSIAKGIQRARKEFSRVALEIINSVLIMFSLGWVELDATGIKRTRRFGTYADRLAYYYPPMNQPLKFARDIIDLAEALTKANNANGLDARKEREQKRARKI
jgi:hypothetical protein